MGGGTDADTVGIWAGSRIAESTESSVASVTAGVGDDADSGALEASGTGVAGISERRSQKRDA